MELRACPLCGSTPLLLSEGEITCVNGHCPARGLMIKGKVWNARAEAVGRDSQILKELKLEHSMVNNLSKLRNFFPDIS